MHEPLVGGGETLAVLTCSRSKEAVESFNETPGAKPSGDRLGRLERIGIRLVLPEFDFSFGGTMASRKIGKLANQCFPHRVEASGRSSSDEGYRFLVPKQLEQPLVGGRISGNLKDVVNQVSSLR